MWSETKMASEGKRSYNVCDADTSSCESNSSDDDSVYENVIHHKSLGDNAITKRATSGDRVLRAAKRSKWSPSSSDAQDYQEKHAMPKHHKSILQDNTKYNQQRSQVTSKSKHDLDYEMTDRRSSSGKVQKCHSRNAVMARMNRLKKKQYVETLENDISKVAHENDELKGTVNSQTKTIASLKNRIQYLEGVLANSRELGMLLKSVKRATGLPTINSLEKNAMTTVLSQSTHTNDNAVGFPPPQPDHIYSKTPDVTSPLAAGSMSLNSGDNFINGDDPFLFDDQQMSPLLAEDVHLPLPLDDNPKDFTMSADLLDYPAFNEPFDFEKFDGDYLTSGVGICLHIAKKRVSLEFCQSCNNNSVAAWDDKIFADG